jgi:hypothetical protein
MRALDTPHIVQGARPRALQEDEQDTEASDDGRTRSGRRSSLTDAVTEGKATVAITPGGAPPPPGLSTHSRLEHAHEQ